MIALALLSAVPESGAEESHKTTVKPVHGVIPFWADGSDYVCHRATGKITIDGKLDEPDWQRAAKIVLVTCPGNGETKTATFAKLLYDDDNLYFAAEVEDHDLVGSAQGHNAPWGEDDVTELFVKPDTEAPGYWQTGFWEFHAMPQGATRDYLWPRQPSTKPEGSYPAAVAQMANSGMKAAVIAEGTLNNWQDYDKGYTVEMAIPLTAFSRLAPKPKAGDRWRFMVARYDYSAYNPDLLEHSCSAYLPELNFSTYQFYPHMVFGD
jgi:hypothetical protein